MTPTISPYRADDMRACLAVFDANVPMFFDVTERAKFEAFLGDPGGPYFVLENVEGVCGCGGYAGEAPGEARFTWGMIAPDRHGTGLGRALAEHRLAEIRAEGRFDRVTLGTTPRIAPFFEKFGFETVEHVPDGYAPGLDKVEMVLALG